MAEDLLDSARYGEDSDVETILKSGKVDVNASDDGGNTALHKSAANGHVATMRVLIEGGAHFLKNKSNNTPLHWAAMNGSLEACKLLLDSYPAFTGGSKTEGSVDVLSRNSFGKSALTEAFNSGNTEVVSLLLEHDSATEERLVSSNEPAAAAAAKKEMTLESYLGRDVILQGLAKAEMNGRHGSVTALDEDRLIVAIPKTEAEIAEDEKTAAQKKKKSKKSKSKKVRVKPQNIKLIDPDPVQELMHDLGDTPASPGTSITHSLKLNDQGKTISIRELAITDDDPLGKTAEQDTTGLCIWCASLMLARWSYELTDLFQGKNVLELGAGCAVPGLAVGSHSKPSKLYLTDLNAETLENMEFNVKTNAIDAEVLRLDWQETSTWPKEKMDVVLGSDLVYQATIAPLLCSVLNGLVKAGGQFLYCAQSIERAGMDEFIQRLQSDFPFVLEEERDVPEDYQQNPLESGDDAQCFLHFNELRNPYKLYRFVKKSAAPKQQQEEEKQPAETAKAPVQLADSQKVESVSAVVPKPVKETPMDTPADAKDTVPVLRESVVKSTPPLAPPPEHSSSEDGGGVSFMIPAAVGLALVGALVFLYGTGRMTSITRRFKSQLRRPAKSKREVWICQDARPSK